MKISYKERYETLSNPDLLLQYKQLYQICCINSVLDYINRFCFTFNPRLTVKVFPFELWEKQEKFIRWLFDLYINRESGIVEKCRDVGATWCVIAFFTWIFLFQKNESCALYTYKADECDKRGDISTLFGKLRFILDNLPAVFKPVELIDKEKYLRNPELNSDIAGLSGDNPGTGNRRSIILKDESDLYRNAEMVETSLSYVSDCVIDMSAYYHGTSTLFYTKCTAGTLKKITFDWWDNPNHTKEWFEKEKEKYESIGMLHVFESQVNRNPSASIESVIIPSSWINESVLNKEKNTGIKISALDVADEGSDTNCQAIREGNSIEYIEEWGGAGSDITETSEKAFWKAVEYECSEFRYDNIGVGADVKGAIRKIKEKIKIEVEKINEIIKIDQSKKQLYENELKKYKIAINMKITGWDARGSVINPDSFEFHDKTNRELFANAKSQAVFKLRELFRNTIRMLNNKEYNKDKIICICNMKDHKFFNKMVNELAQYQQYLTDIGKIGIIKKGKGQKSPNIADSVVMLFADTTEIYLKWAVI